MGHSEAGIGTATPEASNSTVTSDAASVGVRNEYWLPFTPNKEFKSTAPKMAVRAEGMYYYDAHGNKIIDAGSGLFCTPAGHARKEIADAVHKQLLELDFIPSFLRGHPKAFELAARIAEMTPGDLNRIFYTNSGSEAVESAMKIALAYHRARGEGHRQVFISRERAYHGVNFGGLALSGIVNNRRNFGVGLAGIAHIRHHHVKENQYVRGQGDHGAELAEDLVRMVNLHGAENIAAVFIEPVPGSTGILIPPKGYLQRIREICDQHKLLLVFDEVINGFGRMGDNFASQAFGVTPDILTMAKAVTNGVIPMGAVAVSERIYDGIVQAAGERAIEFFHGYTYSAHPVACAAALATLDIYKRDGLFEKAAALSPYFLDMVWSQKDMPGVIDIRGIASAAAIEFAPRGAPGALGHELQKRLWDAGLHTKTTGDTAIFAPPFIAEKSHIDEMGDKLRKVLKTL